MTRTTSANGLAFLRQNEGRVLRVYPDSCGIPTCGVDHVVHELIRHMIAP